MLHLVILLSYPSSLSTGVLILQDITFITLYSPLCFYYEWRTFTIRTPRFLHPRLKYTTSLRRYEEKCHMKSMTTAAMTFVIFDHIHDGHAGPDRFGHPASTGQRIAKIQGDHHFSAAYSSAAHLISSCRLSMQMTTNRGTSC